MLLKAGFVLMAFALAFAGAVAAVVSTEEPASSAAVKSAEQRPAEPLKRTDPDVKPWREEVVELRAPEEPEPAPKPQPRPDPESGPKPDPAPEPERQPEPEREPTPEPEPRPEPEPEPIVEEPPEPAKQEAEEAQEPRHYDLPDGAVLGLTVKALGLRDVPVFDSIGERALRDGVGHHPETSMPWSDAPQRNVYIAGHRLGFPGTASHLIFYRLGELGEGDEILLKDRDGDKYRYRVNETFKAGPEDSWVMGQVVNRDMVTLQTCTGPNWERRLIVRADRL